MIYPVLTPSKKNTVNVPDFTGGINLSDNQTNIKDNQLVDAQNLRIDNGVVRTREALTLVPCDNFELSDTEILDATSTVSLYLSNRLANPVGMESTALGYYVNNEYIFKIVLFVDKILAVCVYSAEENETGTTKGNVFEFDLNTVDTDAGIVSAVNLLDYKMVVLFNDGVDEPATDVYNSIISTNTVTGFITYSDTTDLNYSVTFRLLNDDGEFEPTFILKEKFSDNAYVPTTVINKDVTFSHWLYGYSGENANDLNQSDATGGTVFEDFNMISKSWKETLYIRKQLYKNSDRVLDNGLYYTSRDNYSIDFHSITIKLSNKYSLSNGDKLKVRINGRFISDIGNIYYYMDAETVNSFGFGRFYFYDENGDVVIGENFNDADPLYDDMQLGCFPDEATVSIRFECSTLLQAEPHHYMPWLNDVYIESIEVTAMLQDDDVPSDNINAYSHAEWFGGARSGLEGGTRLFVAGNPENPNMIRWSALNDVSYFPENNFAIIGRGDEPITAIAKQSNFLAVFTPNSLWAVEYAYDTNSATNATTVYFPTTPISPQFGCDCPNTIQLINDKLTWAHSTGAIYTLIDSNQFSERNVREISAHIRPLLQVEGNNLKAALSADYKGQYIVFAGTNAYVWDYEQASLYNYSSSEKAQERLVFLKWVLPIAPSAVFSEKNSLSIYAEVEVDGQFAQRLFEFDDAEADESMDETGDIEVPITTSFKTKLWDFGLTHIFKRILRLFFGLGSDYDFTASLAYTTDIGAMDSGSTISNEGNFNKGDDVFVIHTNINKARSIQFEVETTTPIKLNSLQVEYSLLGEVK